MPLFSTLNRIFKRLLTGPLATTQSGQDVTVINEQVIGLTALDNSRLKKYDDYINMDDVYGQEVSSSLDATADMGLRRDELKLELIKVLTDSRKTEKAVKELIERLHVEEILWTWLRSEAKFGDLFVEVIWVTDAESGNLVRIFGLKPLPAGTILHNYLDDGRIDPNFPFRQEINGSVVAKFTPWQMIHISLRREPTDEYGTSTLKAARLPFKQLQAMENSLVISRIKKPQFRVHKVDITNQVPGVAGTTLDNYKKQFISRMWMNPSTGNYERHTTPLENSSDIYMGVTAEGGKNAGIDLVEGKSEIDIKDILYIREKMMSALKTPKHRMNINDVGVSNKLASQDQGLYYSATIQRIQIVTMAGLAEIFNLEFQVRDLDVFSKGKTYKMLLPKQRTTDELLMARVELIKSTTAKNYVELGLLSDEIIMKKVLDFDNETIDRIMKTRSNVPSIVDPNNFNKSGNSSAPVRQPQKEDIDKIKNDPEIKLIIEDIKELIKNSILLKKIDKSKK